MLRRLREHLGQQDWFAVILERVIVVAGIFMAFQVDRWYEEQRIKSDLQAHVSSLIEDFAENKTRLTSAISIGKQEIDAALTLRAEMRKTKPDLSVAELNKLVSQISSLLNFRQLTLHIETSLPLARWQPCLART